MAISGDPLVQLWTWAGNRPRKSKPCTLAQAADLVRHSDRLRSATDESRAILAFEGRSTAYNAQKYGRRNRQPDGQFDDVPGGFPAIAWAGVWHGRRALDGLSELQPSGYVYGDIDYHDVDIEEAIYMPSERGVLDRALAVVDKISANSSVALAYVSAGYGVHFIAAVDPAPKTQGDYLCALETLERWIGVEVDSGAKDITRLGTLSYDAAAYYNPNPTPMAWGHKPKPAPTRQTPGAGYPVWIDDALSALDPDCDYAEWVSVGMALTAISGGAGLALWDSWSSQGQKYGVGGGANLPAAKWRSFKRGRGYGLRYLWDHACQSGWTPPAEIGGERLCKCGRAYHGSRYETCWECKDKSADYICGICNRIVDTDIPCGCAPSAHTGDIAADRHSDTTDDICAAKSAADVPPPAYRDERDFARWNADMAVLDEV